MKYTMLIINDVYMLTNFTVGKLSALRLAKNFCGRNPGSLVKTSVTFLPQTKQGTTY